MIRILVLFALVLRASSAAWGLDIPPMVTKASNAKILLLLDDSWSMEQVIEHPDYVKNRFLPDGSVRWPLPRLAGIHRKSYVYDPSGVVQYSDYLSFLPDIVFRVKSGGALPVSTTPIEIALMTPVAGAAYNHKHNFLTDPYGSKYNPYGSEVAPDTGEILYENPMVTNQSPKNISSTATFGTPEANTYLAGLWCNTDFHKGCDPYPDTSRYSYDYSSSVDRKMMYHFRFPPTKWVRSGRTVGDKAAGVDALRSYRVPDLIGKEIFSLSALEREDNSFGGSYVTDRDGSYYLYADVRDQVQRCSKQLDIGDKQLNFGVSPIPDIHSNSYKDRWVTRLGSLMLGPDSPFHNLEGFSKFANISEEFRYQASGFGFEGSDPALATPVPTTESTPNPDRDPSPAPEINFEDPCPDDKKIRATWIRGFSGPVVIHDKQFEVGSGIYSIDYMYWILRHASPSQLASLPTKTRLQMAKESIIDLVEAFPSIDFAYTTMYNRVPDNSRHAYIWEQLENTESRATTYRKKNAIRAPFGIAKDQLIEEIQNTMAIKLQRTPITQAYIEALNYIRDGGDGVPSPVDSECDNYIVILISDGYPSFERPQKLFGNWVENYDNDADENVTNLDCHKTRGLCEKFADDVAFYARNLADFSPTIPGRQWVSTAAISLEGENEFLDGVAAAGGFGSSATVTENSSLYDILSSYVSSLVVSKVTGSAFSTSQDLASGNLIFRPSFNADLWTGNVDVFKVDATGMKFQFDINSVREDSNRLLNLYTALERGGREVRIRFDKTQSANLSSELFANYLDGDTTQDIPLEDPLRNKIDKSGAEMLISFIRGEQVAGLRVRDRNQNGSNADYGDIVYSPVVTVKASNSNFFRLQGYDAYVNSRLQAYSEPQLLFGANDGIFHAVNGRTGQHEWGYIPSELLRELHQLARQDYASRYRRPFVDGPITVFDAYVKGEWRTVAFFGLRGGGYSYVALDITERDDPKLMFSFADKGKIGKSYSKPELILTKNSAGFDEASPGAYKWSVIVGTGEDHSENGYYLANIDLETGQASYITLDTTPGSTSRLGQISVANTDLDIDADRLYVGGENGSLYRVVIKPIQVYSASKVFIGNQNNPITAKPMLLMTDEVFTGNSNDGKRSIGIYFGTGRYDDIADSKLVSDDVNQYIFGIFDPFDPQNDDFSNLVSGATLADMVVQDIGRDGYSYRVDKKGLYRLPLDDSGDSPKGFAVKLISELRLTDNYLSPAGMVYHEPTLYRGILLFPTFVPKAKVANSCAFGGYSLLTGLNMHTGLGVLLDRHLDASKPIVNSGISDLDDSGNVSREDLDYGYLTGQYEAALDTKISSIETNNVVPYKHNGKVEKEDIRLVNSIILPAVSSLGYTGVTTGIQVMPDLGNIFIQNSFVDSNPVTGLMGKPSAGIPGSGIDSDNSPNAPVEAPQSVPLNTFLMPARIITHHEVIK